MSGYWIVKTGEIRDVEALGAYNDIFATIAKRYGAEMIAGRGRVETVEGAEHPRQFILRFESYETAKSCYDDPDYQAVLPLAARACSREISIVEGV
jgi:uncharacterized protein (DUF1330 family)